MAATLVRSRLVQQLIFHIGERGTVLEAPDGWGKTTALRHYFEVAGDAAGSVWLNVRPQEKAADLWTRLHSGFASAVGVRAPKASSPVALADALRSLTRMPTFLVMDDFHNADPELGVGLVDLIEHTDQGVYVQIATRGPLPGPLPLLASSGVLRRITAKDLAFTSSELRQLIELVYGHTPDENTVDSLLNETGGRPASVIRSLANRPPAQPRRA